jgi:hypothetical protein
LIFSGKVFDMDFLQTPVYGVLELPLPRNAQKGASKKVKKQIFGERERKREREREREGE